MDKEFVDAEIKRVTRNLDNNLVAMKMQEMKLEKKLFDYVSSDIIDSY